jgi:hypothetical protein
MFRIVSHEHAGSATEQSPSWEDDSLSNVEEIS